MVEIHLHYEHGPWEDIKTIVRIGVSLWAGAALLWVFSEMTTSFLVVLSVLDALLMCVAVVLILNAASKKKNP